MSRKDLLESRHLNLDLATKTDFALKEAEEEDNSYLLLNNLKYSTITEIRESSFDCTSEESFSTVTQLKKYDMTCFFWGGPWSSRQ